MSNGGISGYEVTYIDDYWQGGNRVILVIEDHQLIREGMRKIIGDVLTGANIEVLEASTLAEARRIVRERKDALDLILLDINLPDACGADEVECIRNEWAAQPVVVVSASEDWALAAEFMRAGALGFIPKSCNVDLMVNALRLIFTGGRYFPPQVFDAMSDGYVPPVATAIESEIESQSKNPTQIADLSPRQKEVLALMLEGRSNKEIARDLGVSVGTAKNYVAVVLRAYNASSRSKAMLAAMRSSDNGIPEN